jgi:hypothetical protein
LRRPYSFRPSQVPANKAGSPIKNNLIVSALIAPLASDPQRAHQEGRHRHRLKYRALHVLGPAAQAAPDGDEDSGEPGDAAEHAIEEADDGVNRGAGCLDWSDRGTKQRIEAVENQKDADARAHMRRICPGQDADADGDAERRACHKRPELFPVQRAAQFPDRIALHDQAERDDQRRGLQGCKDVEPDRRGDQAERKAGEARDQRAGKCCKKKDRNLNGKPIHVLAPSKGEQRLNGIAISRGGCDVPGVSLRRRQPRGQAACAASYDEWVLAFNCAVRKSAADPGLWASLAAAFPHRTTIRRPGKGRQDKAHRIAAA